jgi:quinol monooxygenase YgiN
MVSLKIIAKTYANKELEFTQSIESLVKEFRKQRGCLSYQFTRQSENEYCLESEWKSWVYAEMHFKSSLFSKMEINNKSITTKCKHSEEG